ncbi:MAG: hypothetical protein AB7F28_06475 [Candidatus Margulisiibacteriota bacterium]
MAATNPILSNTPVNLVRAFSSGQGTTVAQADTSFQNVLDSEIQLSAQRASQLQSAGGTAGSGVAVQQPSIADYLRAQYFGRTISYTDASGATYDSGQIKELVVGADGAYYFNLKDGQRVRVVFQGQEIKNPSTRTPYQAGQARLDSERYLNSAISPLLSDAGEAASNARSTIGQTSSYQSRQSAIANLPSEPLTYIDTATNQEKTGDALVLGNRLVLKTSQAPIKIRFEREN